MAGILHKTIRDLLLRYAPGLPVLALVITLAAQLAHWTWVFGAPETQSSYHNSAQTDVASESQAIIAQHLFGSAQPSARISSDEALQGIRLKGVFAALRQRHSYAILNTGGKNDQTVRIGDEIQSGVSLKSVYPQYIVVSHEGELKRLNLPQNASASALIQVETARLGISSVGYNAYSISRNILSAALQKQETNIGQLTASPGGGLLVTAASSGSIAEKLGLQAGDILFRVNNQSVSTMAELSSAYQRLKQETQVQLELTRSGKQIQLRYTVQQ